MVREGVDFSSGRPTAMALRQAGRDFVVRYVSAGTHAKEITPTEAAYWRANNIDVVIVYESTAGRALAGRLAGQADAAVAWNDVRACGGPADGGVVYFAVDFDATDAQMRAILDYLTGAARVLGESKVGVYGSYNVVDFVLRHSPIRWLWQTYAWSNGRVHPAANLYQYRNNVTLAGVQVDYDRAYTANFGQWFYNGEDEDMTETSDAIIAYLRSPEYRLAVRGEVITALADPTHSYLQDELKPLKDALAEIDASVGSSAAAILGALTSMHLTLTDAQVQELASHLGIDYDRIERAVRFQVTWPS